MGFYTRDTKRGRSVVVHDELNQEATVCVIRFYELICTLKSVVTGQRSRKHPLAAEWVVSY
jgi:hypothetical protein